MEKNQENHKHENPIEFEKFPNFDEVERIIGYEFKDRALLEQAFTHGSYKDDDSDSYERLEYVGDSVLNIMIADNGFRSYSGMPPGMLTRIRAANVDTEKLARVAVKHSLYKYLRHKKPLLKGQIEGFMEAMEEYPLRSNGLIDAPKVLADIVESTIGAIYLDTNSSQDLTWKVAMKLIEPIITPETLETHPTTKFYEFCQKHGFKVKLVDLWSKEGAIEIFVDDEFVGRGIYMAKKLIALNRAANIAYNQLVKNLSVDVEGLHIG